MRATLAWPVLALGLNDVRLQRLEELLLGEVRPNERIVETRRPHGFNRQHLLGTSSVVALTAKKAAAND